MGKTSRRDALLLLAALGIAGAAPPGSAAGLGAAEPFSWAGLQDRARRLAGQRYRAPAPALGAHAVDFDQAGRISFRPERTLAGGIRLFPVSRAAPVPVRIAIVEGATARAVAFTPDLFEATGGASVLGIGGFRAMAASGNSDWLAFMGASYFRTAGSQDQYGLSARGVAIDTGISGAEEFPTFTDFWIERTGTQGYTIHALLDGPSVTGAFRFASALGTKGVVQDVSCVLFARKAIARLGIAPATSMFWYGEGDRGPDWRPEIHDSDGLAIRTGSGERIWRPLVNPPRELLNSFADINPRGFGLMQRDRAFANYQDDGAFYDRRPNLWVEPKGDWGKGAVTLFQFPTDGETTDNVVAFWVPAAPVRAGARLAFDYRLSWTSDDPSTDQGAHAVDIRRGTAGRPGLAPVPGARKLVVDFAGAALAGLDRQSGVEPQIDASDGRVLASAAYPVVGQAGRWRVTADIAGGSPAEVRLFLKRGADALSETVLVPLF